VTPAPAPAKGPAGTTKPQAAQKPVQEVKQVPVPAPPKQPATATQQEMARLRQAMNAARTVAEIKEVSRQAQELAGALPGNAEVGRLAAEAAYRSSEWVTAASLYSQLEIDPESEPLACFYASVSFFEVGKTAEAAGLLRRCQALLAVTPAVARYIERILGPRDGGAPRP
jgi:hypothetical protein